MNAKIQGLLNELRNITGLGVATTCGTDGRWYMSETENYLLHKNVKRVYELAEELSAILAASTPEPRRINDTNFEDTHPLTIADLKDPATLSRLGLQLIPTPESQYPCAKCGRLRTKAEGGTTFTVCDECWNASTPEPQRINNANFDRPPVDEAEVIDDAYFNRLRHDPDFHLGGGDVRLTLGMQDKIVALKKQIEEMKSVWGKDFEAANKLVASTVEREAEEYAKDRLSTLQCRTPYEPAGFHDLKAAYLAGASRSRVAEEKENNKQ